MIQLIESGSSYEDDIEAGDEAQDLDEEAVMNSEGEEETSWRVIVSSLQGIDHLDPQQ